MKKVLIGIGIFLGIIILMLLIGGGCVVSTRNNFVTLEENINGAFADIDVQLQRRFDLIPNLVETVKGYAAHESEVFQNLADARANYAGASGVNEKAEALNKYESSLSRLMMIVENYPNLKADQSFNRLMDELAGTENRIAVSRRRYNESVKTYNTEIRKMPANIIASLFNFTEKQMLVTPEEAREAPRVQF
jgi:LemA protein